mgnify:CR=1 FL=1
MICRCGICFRGGKGSRLREVYIANKYLSFCFISSDLWPLPSCSHQHETMRRSEVDEVMIRGINPNLRVRVPISGPCRASFQFARIHQTAIKIASSVPILRSIFPDTNHHLNLTTATSFSRPKNRSASSHTQNALTTINTCLHRRTHQSQKHPPLPTTNRPQHRRNNNTRLVPPRRSQTPRPHQPPQHAPRARSTARPALSTHGTLRRALARAGA